MVARRAKRVSSSRLSQERIVGANPIPATGRSNLDLPCLVSLVVSGYPGFKPDAWQPSDEWLKV